jgi:hypothetical protein
MSARDPGLVHVEALLQRWGAWARAGGGMGAGYPAATAEGRLARAGGLGPRGPVRTDDQDAEAFDQVLAAMGTTYQGRQWLELLTLYHLRGLPMTAIAVQLGVSEQTLRMRWMREAVRYLQGYIAAAAIDSKRSAS